MDIVSIPMESRQLRSEFTISIIIGKHWNKKFIHAVPAVLNSPKGCIGKGPVFFYEAFGSNEKRFWTIMWMTEAFISYRMKFKENLTREREQGFYSLPASKLETVKTVVAENSFKDFNLLR